MGIVHPGEGERWERLGQSLPTCPPNGIGSLGTLSLFSGTFRRQNQFHGTIKLRIGRKKLLAASIEFDGESRVLVRSQAIAHANQGQDRRTKLAALPHRRIVHKI
jgi:hypothetical protein